MRLQFSTTLGLLTSATPVRLRTTTVPSSTTTAASTLLRRQGLRPKYNTFFGFVSSKKCVCACVFIHRVCRCEGCCAQKMVVNPVEFTAQSINQSCCVPVYKRSRKTVIWCSKLPFSIVHRLRTKAELTDTHKNACTARLLTIESLSQ